VQLSHADSFAPLDRLLPADAARAGGKAFNCARLKQAGFPVPDGLVVFAGASDGAVTAVAEHEWFDSLPATCLFAVRSSGLGEDSPTHSFAGIHETMLNVPRGELSAAVAACRASARSPRAATYRSASGLSAESTDIGVLIQRMVRADVSGVAFTVNPLTGAENELVINAARGLGEALVSGVIDPDEYIVHKTSGEQLLRRLGDDGTNGAPALSDADVAALAALLRKIEAHYGAPQDVEWCRDEAGFWIVQSRPVTAVRSSDALDLEWTRANFAEVFPDLLSPQALAAFEELLLEAQRLNVGGLAAPESELGPLVKSFAGRMYFNLSQMRRICRIGGIPPAAMLRSLGHSEAIAAEDEVAPRPPIGDFVRALPDFARIAGRHLRVARIVREQLARMAAYLARLKAVDPSRLSDAELWAELDEWQDEGPAEMQTVLLLAGVIFQERPIRSACEAVGFPFEHLVYPQLAAGERSVSSRQAFDLVALAESARKDPRVRRILTEVPPEDYVRLRAALDGTPFLADLDRFLDNYGHRGVHESDWSLPRLHEDPTPIFKAMRAHVSDDARPAGPGDDSARERDAAAAWTAFTGRLNWWQRLVTLPRVRRAVATIKRYYVWRERVRSDMVRVLAVLRRWHLVLADRFVERGWLDDPSDYFLVQLPEIAAVIAGRTPPASLRPIVARRRAEQDRYRSMRMPLFMKEGDLPRLLRASAVSGLADLDGDTLTGLPVSGGLVEGEVVVVRDPADFGRMTRGAILVAPATDPSWTPLFTLAAGVIVEVGGVLSHASTIAREFGLPAIANVKHATRRLRTGERVRLDAHSGRIERITP
jgi:phosphohistidine swiveling domain-containing protein